MKRALCIFPHQLFENHPGLRENPDIIFLIEDSLFFGDIEYPCNFHAQKLVLHRASMKYYAQKLETEGYNVRYIEYAKKEGYEIEIMFQELKKHNIGMLDYCEVIDFILDKRIRKYATEYKIKLHETITPGFINTTEQNKNYRSTKNKWFMADFYKEQRKRLNILMNSDGTPIGGKWSFDEDNRKKIPKKDISCIPYFPTPDKNIYVQEAKEYVATNIPQALGTVDIFYYAITHHEAQKWLDDFLELRFKNFGDYEDAMVQNEPWLYHSVLTPMLNIGLLTPEYIVEKALEHSKKQDIPINSLEGFIRQIVGWREFMRATYEDLGVTMRTGNHWNHTNTLPKSFYDGTTGIEPVDDVIKSILKTGYCHHIERLMVLGNIMFLCEIHPQEIYKWFMEMFVDSYDWVMVPNVYAMSQNADGGLITTKPYFSGSNYIRKMSHYKKAEWADIWDGLYWRWILKNKERLKNNYRWSMMVRMAEKMDDDKKHQHIYNAENFYRPKKQNNI